MTILDPWRKCKPGMIRRVDFALGPALVLLISTFVYQTGRVYQVEDILTGHLDFVGAEYLIKGK